MKEQSKPRAIAAVPSESTKDDIAAKVHATASASAVKWAARLDSLRGSGAEIVRSAVEAAPGSDPLVMGAIELDVQGPPLVAAFHLVHGHY